jgi:hypothetical protein
MFLSVRAARIAHSTHKALNHIAFFSLLALATGCGKRTTVNCGPLDQRSAYLPPLSTDQVVRVDMDSTFTADQKLQINRAIRVWNTESQKVIGKDFFRSAISTTRPGEAPTSADGKCSFASGDETTFKVIRMDNNETWAALGANGYTTGLTIRCGTTNSVDKQIILLNTKTIVGGQFMSVTLHELGHAIGLDHSCNDQDGDPSWVACSYVKKADHPYRQAVMYPVLNVSSLAAGLWSGGVELKESLTSNDAERAECRYKD